MTVSKPPSVEADPCRSAKWDEIVTGRRFRASDAPALTLLVQWYQVVERCIEDMGVNGGVQVAYQNDLGDIKALPQIATMKQASAEIRALNRQLDIADGRDVEGADGDDDEAQTVLRVVQGRGAGARRASSG